MKFFKSKQQQESVKETPIKPEATVTSEPTPKVKPSEPEVAKVAEPAVVKEATPAALMTQLTEIAANYNQAREQLQQKLFVRLDQLKAAQASDNETLGQIASEQEKLDAKIASLEMVDTSALDAQIASSDATLKQLTADQAEQAEKAQTATSALGDLKDRRESLTKQLAALKEDAQALTDKFRAETDPLAILNMADAMRTQVERSATERQHLETELETVEGQYNEQQQLVDSETAKANTLKQKLEGQQAAHQQLQSKRETLVADQSKAAQAAKAERDSLEAKRQSVQANVTERDQELADARQQMKEWFGSTHRVNALDLEDGGMFIFVLDTFLPKRSEELANVVKYLLDSGIEKVGLYSGFFDINLQYEVQSWAHEFGIDGSKLEVLNPLLQMQTTGVSVSQTPIRLPEATARSWNADHTELTLQIGSGNRTLRVRYYDEPEAQISNIGYLDGDRVFKHSFFDRQGHLLANAMFDDQGALKQEEYYRQDGILALTITYVDSKQHSVEVFDQNGVLRRDFADSDTLTQWWLTDAFPKDARLIGCFNHPAYNTFLTLPEVKTVPYVTAGDTLVDGFDTTVREVNTSSFIVSNYSVAEAIVQAVDHDVALLQLNNVNLPFQIGSPTVS